ncbi:hypothetical protein HOY82DRAFT_535419 [Tuber indicum]|nr:hypothetical protein HOY82DRAFT_535419 [Tuber indicum]
MPPKPASPNAFESDGTGRKVTPGARGEPNTPLQSLNIETDQQSERISTPTPEEVGGEVIKEETRNNWSSVLQEERTCVAGPVVGPPGTGRIFSADLATIIEALQMRIDGLDAMIAFLHELVEVSVEHCLRRATAPPVANSTTILLSRRSKLIIGEQALRNLFRLLETEF